ncbi:MAG: ThiF family adenylyltransferase [Candidatus Levybacteria bacterium]|nr:ThiF family adenylyltransferase [Candidatus Levybacteria bacterium]
MGKKIAPIILQEGKYTASDLEELSSTNRIWKIHDIYKNQLSELFEITHPALHNSPDYSKKRSEFIYKRLSYGAKLCGNWVYFPWNGRLIHMVNEEDYFLLRTNRNKNLINHKEQQKLRNVQVGIVGLSIGNMIATSLVYNGIADFMKIVDHDTLETTNLNRVRSTVYDIGTEKNIITLQEIYEINPYAKIAVFKEGLTKKTMHNFFFKDPVPDIVFDAIDDFEMKIRLRIMAKQCKIPVIMLTNLGDTILIDIERYDINPDLPLFNGLIRSTPEEILKKKRISEDDKQKYAVNIVGIDHVPKRALASISEINKTLVGRPQLGSTVTITGGVAAYLVKRLALHDSLPSGRTHFSLDNLLKK